MCLVAVSASASNWPLKVGQTLSTNTSSSTIKIVTLGEEIKDEDGNLVKQICKVMYTGLSGFTQTWPAHPIHKNGKWQRRRLIERLAQNPSEHNKHGRQHELHQ